VIELDVAIIGGGFSGCAVAAQLARRADAGFSCVLFEPGELGRGAAYGTQHGEHVLNTRARAMSIYPDDPDHFVRWLGLRAAPTDFVSRRLYGDYVNEVAKHAFERPRFTLVRDRVSRVRRGERGGFVLASSRGAHFLARSVVLATGNFAPSDDFLPREIRLHPGYVADPWRFDHRVIGGHVLVIGSGLTALDVLVALSACGHRGTVHILSRRGRFPEVHADVMPYDVIPALETSDAGTILRSFRRHVDEAARRGFDWRAVVDAIRPEAEAIWRRLSPQEQRRFERHLRAVWERHRHRAPQQVEAVRQEYARNGRLFSYAGRLLGMQSGAVSIAVSGGETIAIRPDWIVNCTGLGRASAMVKDPLLGALLADGTISVAPNGLGLRTGWELQALDSSGETVPDLWIVGPAVRGSRIEATAVPELRVLAELVAIQILRPLRAELAAHSSA
jgi:uncharacterized NAD(P)/FAD-binding protein YdhS